MAAYQLIISSETLGMSRVVNAYNTIAQWKTVILVATITKLFLVESVVLDIFKLLGLKYMVFKVIGTIAGLGLTGLLFMMSDPRIACYILQHVIDNCTNISTGFFKLFVIMGVLKKFWEAVKEGLKDIDFAEEKKQREEEKKQREEESLRRDRQHEELLEAIKAQRDEAVGSNGESLKQFRKRLMREQRMQLVSVVNNTLTDTLDQYDGITLRYDPMQVYRSYASEASSDECTEDVIARCEMEEGRRRR